jgi:hypothetical protein
MALNGAKLTPQEQERRQSAVALASTGNAIVDAELRVQDPALRPPNMRPGEVYIADPLPTRVDPESDPIDTWVMTDQGLARWRPIFDHLRVFKCPNGARVLRMGDREVRLDQDQARHLAQLLYDREASDVGC